MKTNAPSGMLQAGDIQWQPFRGGELEGMEGKRPRLLCPECREQLRRQADPRRSNPRASEDLSSERSDTPAPLCFGCYRVGLARDRALLAAAQLNTASEERFQSILPLEPVNQSRLVRLRAERATARAADRAGAGVHVDKRRRAQLAARHALEQISAGLRRHQSAGTEAAAAWSQSAPRSPFGSSAARQPSTSATEWSSVHAAELQLPDAWLPFVMSR